MIYYIYLFYTNIMNFIIPCITFFILQIQLSYTYIGMGTMHICAHSRWYVYNW
jgi:hypothetical protein